MLNRWNPDKHLRIRNPRLRLALRMMWYCMVVSSIGGTLFTLPFLLDFPNSTAENVTQAMILAIFFGGGTALQFRLLASILIGAAMAIVSGGFSTPITNPWVYRLAMALSTATIVHLFAPIGLVRFLSFGAGRRRIRSFSGNCGRHRHICGRLEIYLSQVMAQKYLPRLTTT